MTARTVASKVAALSPVALAALVALAMLAGCGSKESVMLSARVESAELAVASNALVTDVTGSFELVLSLGDRASDPTSVELGTFSLQRGSTVLLDPLEISTDPSFPVDIGVGGSKRVDVTISHPNAEPELASELCSAELKIVGTLTDTLGDDRPLTVSSGSFAADCP